jgi:DNA polymerase-3 subunit beta
MFKFDGTSLISRLIEEKYPNYETVIPLDNERMLIVSKNEMLQSVRRVSLYSNSTTHQIRLSVGKDELRVTAEDQDFGSEAKEKISCDYNDEEMEIGFNSAYVIDVLVAYRFRRGGVQTEFAEPRSPSFLRSPRKKEKKC